MSKSCGFANSQNQPPKIPGRMLGDKTPGHEHYPSPEAIELLVAEEPSDLDAGGVSRFGHSSDPVLSSTGVGWQEEKPGGWPDLDGGENLSHLSPSRAEDSGEIGKPSRIKMRDELRRQLGGGQVDLCTGEALK